MTATTLKHPTNFWASKVMHDADLLTVVPDATLNELLPGLPPRLLLKRRCIGAILRDPSLLQTLPPEARTRKLAKRILPKLPDMMVLFKGAVLTYELCLHCVIMQPILYNFVPEHYNTEAMALAAVRQHGLLLQSTPPSLRTIQMCEAAYCNTVNAIAYIPLHLRPYIKALPPGPPKVRGAEVLNWKYSLLQLMKWDHSKLRSLFDYIASHGPLFG